MKTTAPESPTSKIYGPQMQRVRTLTVEQVGSVHVLRRTHRLSRSNTTMAVDQIKKTAPGGLTADVLIAMSTEELKTFRAKADADILKVSRVIRNLEGDQPSSEHKARAAEALKSVIANLTEQQTLLRNEAFLRRAEAKYAITGSM